MVQTFEQLFISVLIVISGDLLLEVLNAIDGHGKAYNLPNLAVNVSENTDL